MATRSGARYGAEYPAIAAAEQLKIRQAKIAYVDALQREIQGARNTKSPAGKQFRTAAFAAIKDRIETIMKNKEEIEAIKSMVFGMECPNPGMLSVEDYVELIKIFTGLHAKEGTLANMNVAIRSEIAEKLKGKLTGGNTNMAGTATYGGGAAAGAATGGASAGSVCDPYAMGSMLEALAEDGDDYDSDENMGGGYRRTRRHRHRSHRKSAKKAHKVHRRKSRKNLRRK